MENYTINPTKKNQGISYLRFKHFQESKKHWKELNKNRNSSDLANYGTQNLLTYRKKNFPLKYLTHQ
ncbi:hypothetical protein O3M35_004227 [Rhynocoris fuscipes]|uniref:Ycf1 n=1 Tax=Rhynocoris fuscipes TaxID=488301 RepID=A0AAW1CGS9_9HEMI